MSQSRPEPNSRLAAIANPFLRDVVGSALDEAKADVPRINAKAFERCVKLIAHVAAERESTALLLFGEPGSGKTHLLSRVRKHLEREDEAGRRSVFIPLRMQTSPGMIWRSLRRQVAEALTRRKAGTPAPVQWILEERRHELESLAHRDLGLVLENLVRGVHVRDSTAWLAGHELPDAALMAIGLSALPVDEEYQEERAYEVIRDIAQLAEPAPLVFCLDQVEALQRHMDDQEGIFALGKLVSTLHDTLRNAAIICCVQTSFIDQIKRAIRGSEQDRLLSNRAGLTALNWEQAMDLVEARLATQPELAEIQPRGAGRLWPIDAALLKALFEPDGLCVARKVLHRSKELFDEVTRGVAALPEPLEGMLARLYQERVRVKSAQEADFILRDALPQVLEILGLQPKGIGPAHARGFDLVVEHAGRPAAFALCNQRPGVGLVNRFRKLGENWDQAATPRLVLLRDARLGIGANAKASQQRLDSLRSRHAELVNVSAEALAALDAIRNLLADADSGDLSHNGESVSRKAVEQWIASHLPDPLADLVEQLKGKSGACARIFPALTALLSERKIVSLEDAAGELNVPMKEVIECARQNPQQFAVLDGRSPVLFEPVGPAVAS